MKVMLMGLMFVLMTGCASVQKDNIPYPAKIISYRDFSLDV